TLPANTFTGSATTTNSTSFSGTDLELILGTGRSAQGALLSSDNYTGQLAEFLVFSDQLTVGQINLIANYLSTEYGLPFAYETNILSSASALSGDYNHDGIVNTADYVVWRKSGINGNQGYQDWLANYSNFVPGYGPLGSGSLSQVPEPKAWIITGI